MFTVEGCGRSTKPNKSLTMRCLGSSTATQKNPRENGAQVAWCFNSEAIGKGY